jgi:hypothetical protein
MQKYQGSCHCGVVSFSFEQDQIEKGLRCNCSFCKRKGSVMSLFTLSADALNIDTDSGSLGLYQFGDKIAKHYFCKTCGIHPFLETFRMPGHFRVNLGCVDGVDTDKVEIDLFDGKNLL